MPRVTLSNPQKIVIAQLYQTIPETVDQLPYTPEFDALYDKFVKRTSSDLDKNQFWRALSNARKASKLMRKAIPRKEEPEQAASKRKKKNRRRRFRN